MHISMIWDVRLWCPKFKKVVKKACKNYQRDAIIRACQQPTSAP